MFKLCKPFPLVFLNDSSLNGWFSHQIPFIMTPHFKENQNLSNTLPTIGTEEYVYLFLFFISC